MNMAPVLEAYPFSEDVHAEALHVEEVGDAGI